MCVCFFFHYLVHFHLYDSINGRIGMILLSARSNVLIIVLSYNSRLIVLKWLYVTESIDHSCIFHFIDYLI